MIKLTVIFILVVIWLQIAFSQQQQQQCIIFINNISSNNNETCGNSTTNACDSLHSAIQACDYQQLTLNMVFNFANGSYPIASGYAYPLYNQVLTLNGVSNETIFDFTGSTTNILEIIEPPNGNFGDTTELIITNVQMTNLQTSFLQTNTYQSHLTVTLTNVTFNHVNFALNALSALSIIATAPQGQTENDVTPVNLNLQNCEFSYLSSEKQKQGIAINAENVNIAISHCLFANNTGSNSIIFTMEGTIEIDNTQFIGNQISSMGVLTVVNQVTANQSISSTTFDNNSLWGNSSGYSIASIVIFDSTLNIIDCEFTNNIITSIWDSNLGLETTSVTVSNSKFIGNQVLNGVIYAGYRSSYVLDNSLFQSNVVTKSSVVVAEVSKSINSQSSKYLNNQGIIFILTSSLLELFNNTATDNGDYEIISCQGKSNIQVDTGNIFDTLALINCQEGSNCQINTNSIGLSCPKSTSSSKESSSTDDSKSKKPSKTAIILISVLSGIALLAIITIGLVYLFKFHKKSSYQPI
ncbi:Pol protein [Tieghemostelium lacteum]|uniref:Pol protein n=1 Tax=Tieghemostelium lacteum TaxID=361077 RepID=A0A151ZHX8_TIELA|nr:Pol protein [Tieghemostelium lacteum]|eukprot:KYQ93576.1 Pol protein [Tieghemostelium lacteum]